MEVKVSNFEMVTEIDQHPDLSWLGEFSNDARVGAINHRERSGNSNYYRWFNPENPDYAEEDYKRMTEYNKGYWHMLCIKARVTLDIEIGERSYLENGEVVRKKYTVSQTIETPGLYGVESDADDSYHNEIFEEECHTLRLMLEGMGMEVIEDENKEAESV